MKEVHKSATGGKEFLKGGRDEGGGRGGGRVEGRRRGGET